MRFGVCGSFKDAAFVKACGYAYIELALRDIAAMTDAEFADCKATLEQADIKAEVLNNFFPSGYPLVGPDVDLEKIGKRPEFRAVAHLLLRPRWLAHICRFCMFSNSSPFQTPRWKALPRPAVKMPQACHLQRCRPPKQHKVCRARHKCGLHHHIQPVPPTLSNSGRTANDRTSLAA